MRRPLLISHDLSYSGAPVAILALAQALKRLGESPMVVALVGGPLADRFHESGIEMTTRVDPADVAFVIANTILSVPSALRFKRFGILVSAWIHESAYFFRILNLSPQACGLPQLDIILAPSKFQLLELEPVLSQGNAYQLRNVVRQDSYRTRGDESMLAVCGQWESRKGQAQLAALAEQSATDCRFKFIGAERPPGHVFDEAKLSSHRFLGLIDPDAAKLEIAKSGALVSCAAAETQNLCAIEALMAGRPVLLSDIDAHRTLANLIPNVFLFDRMSPPSFAAGYARLRDAMGNEAIARKASATAVALFGEAAFDRRLFDVLQLLRQVPGAGAAMERFQDT